jgi:hypothetical protein
MGAAGPAVHEDEFAASPIRTQGIIPAGRESPSNSSSDTENGHSTVVAPLAPAQKWALKQIERSYRRSDPDRLTPPHIAAIARALVYAGEQGFERSGRADATITWLQDNPEEDRVTIWCSDLVEIQALTRSLTRAGIAHTGLSAAWRAGESRVLTTTSAFDPLPEDAVVLTLGLPPKRHNWTGLAIITFVCEEGGED